MALTTPAVPGEIAPRPTKLFSAREIAEKVLRLIGDYSPNDEDADGHHVGIVLEFMELIVGQLAGTETCQWLIPHVVDIELEADASSFDLIERAGAQFPSRYVAWVSQAYILDANGNEQKVDLIRRESYDDKSDKTTSGTPNEVHVSRENDRPTIYVYPVPADDTLTLRLTCQTYAPSVMGELGQEKPGDMHHGMDRTWQLWLVHETAVVVGDGPIRKCANDSLARWKKTATASLARLLARQNREKHSTRLRRSRPYGA